VWNKRPEDNSAPRPQPEPVRAPAPPPGISAAAVAAATRIPAVIGASMQIKGEIRSREELVVDGEVEGVLESASSITVGPNGKVKANIKAREVAIFGSVRGNVEVTEKLAIRDKGSLIGDIKTAGISIDDGAYFKGSIDIVRPEPVRQQKAPTVNEPAQAAGAAR
jgi:cytoskeletal protein CcmA (bactofilin family)